MAAPRKIPQRQILLRLLGREGPLALPDLIEAAGGSRSARQELRAVVGDLVRDGSLVQDREGRFAVAGRPAGRARGGGRDEARRADRGGDRAGRARPAREPARGSRRSVSRSGDGGPEGLAIGPFAGHRDGFGFVNTTDGSRDVFIPPHGTGGAMHGDLVEYQVTRQLRDGRREGVIVRVAGARGQRIVGVVTRVKPQPIVVPFDPRAGDSYPLEVLQAQGIAEGVAVSCEIPRRPGGGPARLLEVLGPIDQPGVDLEVLIRKHDLRVAFPDEVLSAVEALPREVPKRDLLGRSDFSGGTVVTIDGETAKDFDDAISVRPESRGGYELAVHIADVAHYVRPGTSIDIEARLRGTSVYFPGRAIPMLPPALSEELCSLKPGVPRLVQSVVMRFDREGNLKGSTFHDGWIQSRARLTYGRVNALLGGEAPRGSVERGLSHHLASMRTLAEALAARRAARGGLDFDLPEPEVVLDALGATEGIRPAPRGPAQRIIEEFMIAANMAVAAHLVARGAPVLHRVHERPDPTRVSDLARVAASFGFRFHADPGAIEPADFRALCDAIARTPEERILSRLILRTMALARYSPEPLGHFGLAATDYLHFTSPIRRYPDLVAHRALRRVRAGDGAPSRDEPLKRRGKGSSPAAPGRSGAREDGEDLNVLAADCSRLERGAEAAERESLAWKRAELLQGRVGERMDGWISSITPAGLFVALDDVYAEGFLPISALPRDHYRQVPLRLSLIGTKGGHTFRAGDRLRVIVARVDRVLQRIELALEEERAPTRGPATR